MMMQIIECLPHIEGLDCIWTPNSRSDPAASPTTSTPSMEETDEMTVPYKAKLP